MVRTDSWSFRMLALISLELTWTPSIFTCQTGLKSMSDLRYKADQFSSISLWNFQDPPQSLCLTRMNFVQQFEVTCTTVLMHILKVFIFLFFFSGVIRLNKDGSGETPVGPPSFGKLNGISLYHQGGWFKCSYIKMTFNPGHFT